MGWGRIFFVLVSFCLCIASHGGNWDTLVTFLKVPSPITSSSSAAFAFNVSGGTSGRCYSNCSIMCKLDDQILKDCRRMEMSYSNLEDGEHKFEVHHVNGPGKPSVSRYKWTIDTIHPTASISTPASFTNASNVSVMITFNKPCLTGSGFLCSSIETCNLLVYGPGQVIPSTLEVLKPNLKFSILVNLSTVVEYGRVILAMRRGFCRDSAGKRLIRTANSTYLLRFDRRMVFANLSVHIPTKLVQLNERMRAVQASNNRRSLIIYLSFSVPVLNSSSEISNLLHVSSGFLIPVVGRSLGTRRFDFMVKNISSIVVVTVTLQTSAIVSRQGTLVSPTEPITFLYDSLRPAVKLTTTSEKRSSDHYLPVLIKFSEPVFDFNASGITISGGHLLRFTEISWSLYSIDVQADHSIVSLEIPESITWDIAGNKNQASNILQVMHCSIPGVSVVVGSITTVVFALTSLAAGLLTTSTSSLQYFGALSKPLSSHITYDPSRNLVRTACHIQVFALSQWLPMTLPVEYYEFVKRLQWSIPYLNLPWETKNYSSFHYPLGKRLQRKWFNETLEANGALTQKLSPMEYASIFESQNMKPEAQFLMVPRTSTGWNEFKRNMFWLAIIGGTLVLLHVTIILLLKVRNSRVKSMSHGAFVLPRLELFLIILALPCVSQAASGLFTGGSIPGVIVGIILLGFSSLCLLSFISFLTAGVTICKMLRYKEVHEEDKKSHWCHVLTRVILGPGKSGQWTWKNQPDSIQLTRLGPLFEDLRGPPIYMLSHISEEFENQRGEISCSNDNLDPDEASFITKLFGVLRVYYVLLDLMKRVSLAIIAGAYSRRSSCTFAIFFVFGITVFQLLFMVLNKPFIRKVVQFVEIVAVSTEAAVFAVCIVLLQKDSKVVDDKFLGIFMISMFSIGFIMQICNEWYALIKLLLKLGTGRNSLFSGLKEVLKGWLLILIPWKFMEKWGVQLFMNGKGVKAGLCNPTKVSEFGDFGSTPVRQPESSDSLEKPWMKQLREMARASFSQDGKSTHTDPSCSDNRRNARKAQSPARFHRDLEDLFSSATR